MTYNTPFVPIIIYPCSVVYTYAYITSIIRGFWLIRFGWQYEVDIDIYLLYIHI